MKITDLLVKLGNLADRFGACELVIKDRDGRYRLLNDADIVLLEEIVVDPYTDKKAYGETLRGHVYFRLIREDEE